MVEIGLPGSCSAYLKRETPGAFPEKHLAEARRLFEDQEFDYIATAMGYEQRTEKRERSCSNDCGQTLGPKTYLDNDKRPDVECLAGLIITPAWWLEYDWKGQKPPWRRRDLASVLGKGDVLEVDAPTPPIYPPGPGVRTGSYRHYMYVKEKPVWKPELGEHGRWQFEVFHSQRAGEGPETSIVQVEREGWWSPQYYVYILDGGSPLGSIEFAVMKNNQRVLVEAPLAGLELKNVYRATAMTCAPICNKQEPRQVRDPLLLDLDGNGIQTIGLDGELRVDHDADGFSELTGWVDWGDGVLMLDKNGNNKLDNGTELIGDYEILPNGMRSTDGFGSLTFYDADGNGKIDASDPVWSELRIWQGYIDNVGYIGDPSEQGKISTLDEMGIIAIDVNSTITNITDESANTEVRSGQFIWADGSGGKIAEYAFQTDASDTEAVEEVEVSSEISALPQLHGSGTLRNLHQAMALDSTGRLRELVEAFASETRVAERESIMTDLFFKWTGADSVGADSRGPCVDGRIVAALEPVFAMDLGNPDSSFAIQCKDTYHGVFEFFYADLMGQTHLKDWYEKIEYVWDEAKQDYVLDPTALMAAIQESLAADHEHGKELLSEFARSRRGFGFFGKSCYLSFREAVIEMDPDLAWAFDSGGLPVIDQLGQGLRTWSPHIEGTNNAEAVKGSLTEGGGTINGLSGSDVLYGTSRDEIFYQESGDGLLVGGAGNASKDRT
ncbi:MAG: hypothetical protein AB1646_21695 [Thermodesulfobacteriota bacterium]